MKFLKLHYGNTGKEFLINTAVIAGVEPNGTPGNGCVITLTVSDDDGKPRFEVVKEDFAFVERLLTT